LSIWDQKVPRRAKQVKRVVVTALLDPIALAFIDELPDVLQWRRVGLKVAAFFVIGYFTLLSPRGRNFLVGVLNRFKKVESR
jgi:hypothetical protein